MNNSDDNQTLLWPHPHSHIELHLNFILSLPQLRERLKSQQKQDKTIHNMQICFMKFLALRNHRLLASELHQTDIRLS